MTDPLSPWTLRRLREIVRGDASSESDRYRKETKLGEGGMGEVWKAWDVHLGRWVALKLLKNAGKEEEARFEREGRTTARLSHPHIVPIHDVGEHEGRRFISMEYVEGEALGARRLESREAARIIRDAARAAEYAHGQGIVHRDFKPQNLILDRAGHVWVTDFGLARPLQGGTTFTAPGAMVGTPAYMPPEQAAGERPGIRGDVYSLGATLYHLLTGAVPFRGKTVFEVALHVREQEPVRPTAHDSSIPADLEAVVLKAMEKEPERRYATAAELAEDLERWMNGEPVQARPPSVARRWVSRIRRRPGMFALAAVAAAAVLMTAALAVLRYTEARRLGDEGLALAREGRLNEARGKLDRSIALWRMERYEEELARINRDLAARRRSDQLAVLYDDVTRRLDPEIRKAADAGHGGKPVRPDEERRLLERVEAELSRVPAPGSESSLPHAIRGWVLCNVGRVAEGERELDRAAAFAGHATGDPYGVLFRLRWHTLRAIRAMDPAARAKLPQALVDESSRVSRELAPAVPSSVAPVHAGAHYRRFAHALAAAAREDWVRASAEIESLATAPDMRTEALFFCGVARVAAGEFDAAIASLQEAIKARPSSVMTLRWLAEAEIALGRFEEAAGNLERAVAPAGPEREAIRMRLEFARSRGK